MKLSFRRLATFVSFLFTSLLLSQDFNAFQYRNVGPLRGGRVTTVTGTPSLPGTFYLGATGGGVWKTDDYGTTWMNVSDGFFETPSIGAIEVFTDNPNIVYVGTGSDGLRSNVISGKGVYKSINAGKMKQDFQILKFILKNRMSFMRQPGKPLENPGPLIRGAPMPKAVSTNLKMEVKTGKN